MPRRVSASRDVRDALLEAAGRLLHDEGPHALSVRRLADAVGTSTQAIYTQFGGKEGVVRAMYREGFARLAAHMGSVPVSSDARADLRALGHAYRDAALASPHLYDVMFGRAVPEFECTDDDRVEALATFGLLAEGVQRGLDQRVVHGADAAGIAAHLWLSVHGYVSLELTGYLVETPGFDYATTLDRAIEPFLRTAR